ncbi:hypothetical protein [Propionivibrio limicola]|uniref:hypothetical protein n=1 Tax=Propionivibrio limicola TaxID=167645 RepID=UPI0012927CD2|nr:hypothetical protein [Propionivibrio limicola]
MNDFALIKKYAGMIKKIAREESFLDGDDDLMQSAFLQLLECKGKFDSDRGASFATRWLSLLRFDLRRQVAGGRYGVELDAPDVENELSAQDPRDVERWRVAELDDETERLCAALREADTAYIAQRRGVTRRRVQQCVARQIASIACGGDLFAVGWGR